MNSIKPIVVDLPQRRINIVPIFDVHIGAREFQQEEFISFIDKCSKQADTYFVLGGDIVNNSIKTSIANPFDETMRPSEQKKLAVKLLSPIKDKILCVVSGNHEYRSRKETDDDILYDICSKMDIEDRYREDIAILIMRIPKAGYRGTKGRSWVYTMAVTHGTGGGMYIGSSANRIERFGAVIEGLDILVTGHTHKPLTFPSARIKIDTQNKCLIKEQFVAVQASSWLEWGGYSARKMLIPTARVEQYIVLNPAKKEVGVFQC